MLELGARSPFPDAAIEALMRQTYLSGVGVVPSGNVGSAGGVPNAARASRAACVGCKRTLAATGFRLPGGGGPARDWCLAGQWGFQYRAASIATIRNTTHSISKPRIHTLSSPLVMMIW